MLSRKDLHDIVELMYSHLLGHGDWSIIDSSENYYLHTEQYLSPCHFALSLPCIASGGLILDAGCGIR